MTLGLIIILICCGILTNLMSALFGIGGGVLMVPALHTLFPELSIQMISATSLTIVVGTAIINLISFYKQKIMINIKSMLFWSLGMILGVQLGFESSFYVADILIISVFIVTLTVLAIRTFLHKSAKSSTDNGQSHDYWRGFFFCTFGGSVAGLTGIGGGSIMAPLIGQLPSVQTKQIATYSNYMMVIGGLGSLYGYLTKTPQFYLSNSWQIGYVNFSIVAIVVGSSFVTSFFSMKLKGMLKPELTKKLLGIILLVIAIYMLLLQFIQH
ncbi:TSUP family transporter [[Haemophilus] felis]|nr:TSUP family transporter [[Haemophilus] felis]